MGIFNILTKFKNRFKLVSYFQFTLGRCYIIPGIIAVNLLFIMRKHEIPPHVMADTMALKQNIIKMHQQSMMYIKKVLKRIFNTFKSMKKGDAYSKVMSFEI